MKLLIFLAIRIFSVFNGLLAIAAAVKLALGAYTIFTLQKEFRDVSLLKLGELHGEFIFAPVVLTALFSVLAFLSWRFASRFRKQRQSERNL